MKRFRGLLPQREAGQAGSSMIKWMQIGRWPETYRARGAGMARVGADRGPHASSSAAQTLTRLVIPHEERRPFSLDRSLPLR